MGALVEITEIVAIALTLGAGSLLQSAVGFGFGLFVVPLLLLITDLAIYNTIGLMAAAGLTQSVVSVFHLRRHIPFQIGFLTWQFGTQVLQFTLIGFLYLPLVLAGTAVGLWIGGRIPTKQLRQLMIGILFLVAAISILRPWIPFAR